jgi:hypothetical protein
VLVASAHSSLVHDRGLLMLSIYAACYSHLPQYPLATNFGEEEEIKINISKMLLFVLKNVEFIICSLKKILNVLLIVILIMLFSNVSMTF